MRKSTRVVSSGEAVSYDSDSKQTIPGPLGHPAEIGEAVALAASPFFTRTSLFVCCAFFAHFVLGRRHFRRNSSQIVARRDVRPQSRSCQPFLNGLISMIVTAKLHFPPIDLICSLEHERAK